MNLTRAELKLAARLLDLASDVFSNRNCNDFDLTFLSLEERQEIMKAYHSHIGTFQDYDENSVDIGDDFILMEYLSNRIEEESDYGR